MAQSQGVVREIVIQGTQRIEPETVRSYLLIREGDPFDPARIDRSLKSLFATGLFADVTLQRQGDALVVNVVENPVINRIAFEGNHEFDDKTLSSEITLRPRVIYTRTKVQNDVKRVLNLYRRSGRFAAQVDPKVIQLPQNRVDLVFEISEGEPTAVRRIRFVGNKEFDDGELRDVIRTRETRWWRILSTDDTYDPDRLTLDRELLRRFYLSEGYADFRVVSALAELTPDRRDFFITFTVDEGPRYTFGKIKINAHLRNLKPEAIAGALQMEEGDWYDAGKIDKTIDKLTLLIGKLGYAFVEVRPRVKRDRAKKAIDVTFEINEGPRVFVERINITGNVRTADEVIRREFRLVEGDAFNAAKLRRSRQRIQNLDFFDRVKVQQVPGSSPDKTVINVDVKEKSTGQISLGFGFSTGSGVLGDVTFRERNLFGRGQDLRVRALLAAQRSQVDLSFTEPFFLNREMAAGFDLTRITRDLTDFSSFDEKTTGGALRVGYPITEKLKQRWKYGFKQQKVENVEDDASQVIKDAAGTDDISEISHVIQYDARDSAIFPTEGFIVRLATDLAGLGGNTSHLRNVLTAATFYELADQWVLGVKGRGGYIVGLGQDVKLLQRFFLGGDNLRGFATSGVGPRDVATDDALGGEWLYTGSVELNVPLGLPPELGVSGKLFTDVGSSGSLAASGPHVADTGTIRVAIGTGILWKSPFGPVGVDIGLPIVKEDFDQTENIRVNFGTTF